MVNAMVPLQNITLSGSQSSITFANIPTTGYRDLRLVSNHNVSAQGDITFRFNSVSTGYSRVYMFGNGSSTSSGNETESYWWYGITSQVNTSTLDIMDYSATDKHKSVLARTSIAGFGANATAGRWANTAAITSITINASFTSGTTVALYGVVA